MEKGTKMRQEKEGGLINLDMNKKREIIHSFHFMCD